MMFEKTPQITKNEEVRKRIHNVLDDHYINADVSITSHEKFYRFTISPQWEYSSEYSGMILNDEVEQTIKQKCKDIFFDYSIMYPRSIRVYDDSSILVTRHSGVWIYVRGNDMIEFMSPNTEGYHKVDEEVWSTLSIYLNKSDEISAKDLI